MLFISYNMQNMIFGSTYVSFLKDWSPINRWVPVTNLLLSYAIKLQGNFVFI